MKHPDILERFLSYVRIDTQSSDASESFPSTAKQKDLAVKLKPELEALGLQDVQVTSWGYVLATLPSNQKGPVPTIALIAHLDTSPDVSGANVEPRLHGNYQGQDLVISESDGVVLKVSENPYLKEQVGKTIITASGKTLLGADNKAGIAEIMDALTYLVEHPEAPRPNIRVVFTPDEETGRGVEHITVAEIGADCGYTVDGEKPGEIEDETFCADSLEVTVTGINVHPGMAKNKLVNAVKVAARIIEKLPKDALSPETTEKREGYVHPHQFSGNVETAAIKFLIRDFTAQGLKRSEKKIAGIVKRVTAQFPGARSEIKVTESYRNMKVVLDKHPEVLAKAEKAVAMAGLTPRRASIRGGTDGARLCFMGLPTPNLFTGGFNFHSKQEWIALEDMRKASEVIVHLMKLWATE
ncbi:MAG: peptidase T [Candidatus Aminicenantes bacterium]|nr:peptidase T [Candidatus Aminicenantes bacterium]